MGGFLLTVYRSFRQHFLRFPTQLQRKGSSSYTPSPFVRNPLIRNESLNSTKTVKIITICKDLLENNKNPESRGDIVFLIKGRGVYFKGPGSVAELAVFLAFVDLPWAFENKKNTNVGTCTPPWCPSYGPKKSDLRSFVPRDMFYSSTPRKASKTNGCGWTGLFASPRAKSR